MLQFPGLIAIDLYMLLLAGIVVVGVVEGRFPPLWLAFPSFFIAAALGLLLLFRWAWAMTLAAMAFMVGLFLWYYTTEHISSALLYGLLNLVIFLYLVRADLRDKLR